MRQTLAVLLAFALVGSTIAVPAYAASKESTSQEVTYGAGSFFGTLLYAPVKTSFCVVGAVTSGLTLPFGGPQTAGKVATAACGGTHRLFGLSWVYHLHLQKGGKTEGVWRAIADKVVTYDFARLMEGAKQVSCSGFGQAMIERM